MENTESLGRVKQLLKDMRGILERSKDPVIAKLQELVAIEPKSHQMYATIELFTEQHYELSYNRYFYKEEGGTKVEDFDATIYDEFNAAGKSLLPEFRDYALKAFEGVDYTEAEAAAYNPEFYKMMTNFMIQCWAAAGGEHAKTPTFFAMDKEDMCRDLKTGEIMEPHEAARRCGYELAN